MVKFWIVWMLASYGCAALLISAWSRMAWGNFRRTREPCQVTLLLYNSQGSIEWVVRTLDQTSRVDGRPVQIIVQDYGSRDHTQKMLQILQRENPFLFYRVQEGHSEETTPVYQKASVVSGKLPDLSPVCHRVIDLRKYAGSSSRTGRFSELL
ncbi:MAG: hypothetical protein H0Z33_14755 [Bacillaceae bacterium]|nr:hypothetical protein [Bacillaceae bacterium]